MDVYEASRVVFSRIQRLEPENVSKIMGYLLLQDNGDQEMIRLAFGPDALLQSLISTAKKDLGLIPSPCISTSLFNSGSQIGGINNNSCFNFTPVYWSERPATLPYLEDYSNYGMNSHSVSPLGFAPGVFHDYAGYPEMGIYRNKFPTDLHYANGVEGLNLNQSIVGDVSLKPCLFFARGYCKHGNNCRFLHGFSRPATPISPTESKNSDDSSFQSGSLERLEVELQELLRDKKLPVSIASLPQLYYDKFGKTLQAEGYLTESQRHGKTGYSLTKLLARLKNTVTLIDRPHGQHAVVLAEEAHKYLSYGNGIVDDLHGANSGARQIYLTFPAESTFTEEDVSNYFRNYGPVQDVRIPYQQKRMFGFVTFMYPETVKMILAKGNPHFVCRARVLVKPYREKTKVAERRNHERAELPKSFAVPSLDRKDYDHLQLGPRFFDNSDVMRKHMKDREQTWELERRLAELKLGNFQTQSANSSSVESFSCVPASHAVLQQEFSNGLADCRKVSKTSEDFKSLPTKDHFGYLLEVLENNQDAENHHENQEHDSYANILPESPFANLTDLNSGKSSPAPQKPGDLTVENNSSTSIPQESPVAAVTKELICSMCLGVGFDHKKMECSHVFCLNCEIQASRMFDKEQCPICSQWEGNQYFKLPENKDLHDFSGKNAMTTPSVVW
eukprot:TRINITY_DN7795_c0_g1_i1.p1 TRINITY_DN7795_c0_g1~~TRINITY_DN7795_c0_g1_i1.p1  ORF type:complete len:674 (-),score=122.37 TRINITY_DN7795_c0_g1_i1:793-2814(-)